MREIFSIIMALNTEEWLEPEYIVESNTYVMTNLKAFVRVERRLQEVRRSSKAFIGVGRRLSEWKGVYQKWIQTTINFHNKLLVDVQDFSKGDTCPK